MYKMPEFVRTESDISNTDQTNHSSLAKLSLNNISNIKQHDSDNHAGIFGRYVTLLIFLLKTFQ